MSPRKRLASRVFVTISLLSAPSLANGRFPAADQLVVDPGDPTHLLLRTTFGLLESHDAGLSWSWICEAAVGYTGDPAITVLGGGNVLAGYFDFVSVSHSAGCGWNATKLDARFRYAFDVTLDVADASRAWVLAGSVEGALQVGLSLVDASGAIGEVLEVGAGFVPVTVEVAPSNADRIYVSGLVENTGAVVLRSNDRGRTWQRFAVAGSPGLPLFISAVDPVDPDRLYARIDGGGAAVAQAATNDAPSDQLLVSSDGGETWRTVFALDADLLGFALSADGGRLAVGAPGRGVYVASTSDFEFRLTAPVSVLRCLRWIEGSLWACGQENLDGWTLARSTDEGASFAAVWHQQDLRPLECSASGASGACRLEWPTVARSIQADPSLAAPSASAGSSDAESAPNENASTAAAGCALPAAAPSRSCATALAAALGWLARRRHRR